MNAHKRIALCLFFMMVVTACANVATPTPFSSPTATSISTPTLISITPTVAVPTVEPSPTVDPNMPTAPNGEKVQKDDQGYFYTDENNVTYRDTTLTDSNGEVKRHGWFTERVLDSSANLNGGAWLLDANQYGPSGFPMHMFAQSDLSGVPNFHRLHLETPG